VKGEHPLSLEIDRSPKQARLHDEHQHSCAEKIHFIIVDSILKHFRRYIAWGAAPFELVAALGIMEIGESEIGNANI
jgi:hypothetical protein